MRRQIFIAVLVILALRAPFLNVAAQWDDFNYLKAAQHALTDPLHPSHVRYVFLGEWHDMRGHPHPPGVAWTLTALWRLAGGFHEIPFHAAFLSFNLLAALSMLLLARRFSPEHALAATLIFCAAPAFAVSGTSFESDLPFLAFWMAAIACLVEGVERNNWRWQTAAAFAGAGAALYAYQAVVLIPVMAAYLLWRRVKTLLPWLALAGPPLVIGAYQLFERLSTGAFPFQVLSGHLSTHGWDALAVKARSAAAMTAHLGILLPILFLPLTARALPKWFWGMAGLAALGIGGYFGDFSPLFILPVAAGILALMWLIIQHRWQPFLVAWALLFFLSACAIFFAGAQRYLLPMVAPLAILAVRAWQDRPRWLWAAVFFQLVLAGCAAWVNAVHWNETKAFAQSIPVRPGERVWVSGEWGLRWYLEQSGAQPLVVRQALEPGDRLVESVLNGRLPFTVAGGRLEQRRTVEIRPSLPLRIAGLDTRSSFAAVSFGMRPFDFNRGAVDRLTFSEVVAVEPRLTWLPMNAPEAEWQVLGGVYGLEENRWRWASARAAFSLKALPGATRVAAEIFLPEASPARRFELRLNGASLGSVTLPGPGSHVLEMACPAPREASRLEIIADRQFRPPGDTRDLSFIVSAVGYKP